MSDQHSNLESSPGTQAHEEARNQTAATTPPEPQGGQQANPLANVDTQKLLALLKNPTASVRLQPATDWIYGVIGAVVGVIGFWFFVWMLREKITPDVDFGDDLGGVLGALSSLAGLDSPFSSFFMALQPGEYLVLGVVSAVLVGAAFTLVGNWIGGRKRSWTEAATYYGGSQLLFGAGLIVAGILALISAKLGALVAALLLAINLIVLVIQALSLHEVSRDRVFQYVYSAVGSYGIVLYLAYLIFK